MASTLSIKRLRTLALPSLLLAAGGAGAYLRGRFQKSQVFSPQRYPNGIWQPAEFGVPAEDVFFETDDGVKLHAWWVPRKRARGTVLYCHGNSGNITNRIDAFAQFGRLHMNVFAFDYRGYGRSEGEPSEDGLFRDVRAAYDEVTGPLSQHPESVVLFGHSLGGAVAIDAALHRDVAGVVIQSSFTQIRDMARTVMPWGPLGLIARNEFRSIAKVGLIEVPKLFIHGADDPTVPLEMGRRLFEAAADPKEWYEIARAGHNDVYRQGGLRYFWRLQRFFRKCLK